MGLLADPQLPFFVCWESDAERAPVGDPGGGNGVDLVRLEIAGSPHRVTEWLGEPEDHPLDDVEVDWVAPTASPASWPLISVRRPASSASDALNPVRRPSSGTGPSRSPG